MNMSPGVALHVDLNSRLTEMLNDPQKLNNMLNTAFLLKSLMPQFFRQNTDLLIILSLVLSTEIKAETFENNYQWPPTSWERRYSPAHKRTSEAFYDTFPAQSSQQHSQSTHKSDDRTHTETPKGSQSIPQDPSPKAESKEALIFLQKYFPTGASAPSLVDRHEKSVLGVPANASFKEVKSAYKKLSLKLHPDRTLHMEKKEKELAQEAFKLINHAYHVLEKAEQDRVEANVAGG